MSDQCQSASHHQSDHEIQRLQDECSALRDAILDVETRLRDCVDLPVTENGDPLGLLREEALEQLKLGQELRGKTQRILDKYHDDVERAMQIRAKLEEQMVSVKEEIESVSAKIDDERLAVARKARKMKGAKKRIDRFFTKQDDSYIEIILPYSLF